MLVWATPSQVYLSPLSSPSSPRHAHPLRLRLPAYPPAGLLSLKLEGAYGRTSTAYSDRGDSGPWRQRGRCVDGDDGLVAPARSTAPAQSKAATTAAEKTTATTSKTSTAATCMRAGPHSRTGGGSGRSWEVPYWWCRVKREQREALLPPPYEGFRPCLHPPPPMNGCACSCLSAREQRRIPGEGVSVRASLRTPLGRYRALKRLVTPAMPLSPLRVGARGGPCPYSPRRRNVNGARPDRVGTPVEGTAVDTTPPRRGCGRSHSHTQHPS